MLSSRPVSIHHDFSQGGGSLKTPGHGLLQNRAALAENAATLKQKKTFQTPFKPPADTTGGAQFKTPGGKTGGGGGGGGTAAAGKVPALVVSRVLGDKTPFPNRNRNGGGLQTPFAPAQIALELADAGLQAPATALRPSAMRRNVRRSSRASGSLGFGGLNLSALGLGTFQTPRVNGNPWDVEDFELQAPEGAMGEVAAADVEVEDFEEVEYMPPTAVDLPYAPDFDMPDYTALGRALRDFPYAFQADDAPSLLLYDSDDEQRVIASTCFAPPPLAVEDSKPFLFSQSPSPPSTPPTTTLKSSRPLSRPLTSTSTRPPTRTAVSTVRSTPSVSRAATSARLALALKTPAARPIKAAGAAPSTLRAVPSSSRLAPSASSSRVGAPSSAPRPATKPAPPARSLAATPAPRPATAASMARLTAHAPRPATVAAVRPPVVGSRAASSSAQAGPIRPAPARKGEVVLLVDDRAEMEDFRFEV